MVEKVEEKKEAMKRKAEQEKQRQLQQVQRQQQRAGKKVNETPKASTSATVPTQQTANPEEAQFYERDFARDNGHEFCVRMAKIILPEWDCFGAEDYPTEGEQARYYGGVELPNRNVGITLLIFDDDKNDCHRVLKDFIVKDALGYKPVTIHVPPSKEGELSKTKLIVRSNADKLKLMELCKKQVLKRGVYYNIEYVTETTDDRQSRFKGKIYVPDLAVTGKEDFKLGLQLIKEEGDCPELDIDIDRDVDIFEGRQKSGDIAPTGTVTILFNTREIVKEISYGAEIYEVREFINEPLRCYRCHQFGHMSRTCTGRNTCYQCGEEEHDESIKCAGTFCVNCLGKDHHSYHVECPIKLLMIIIEKYCRTYDVPREEVERFMREVTQKFFDELDAASVNEKAKIRKKWANTFRKPEFSVKDVIKKKKMPVQVDKVDKPAVAKTFLDSIGQRMTDKFKKWFSYNSRELKRSESVGDLSQTSRPRRPRFGSSINLSGRNSKGNDSAVQNRLRQSASSLNRTHSASSFGSLTSIPEVQSGQQQAVEFYPEEDLGQMEYEENFPSIGSTDSTKSTAEKKFRGEKKDGQIVQVEIKNGNEVKQTTIDVQIPSTPRAETGNETEKMNDDE